MPSTQFYELAGCYALWWLRFSNYSHWWFFLPFLSYTCSMFPGIAGSSYVFIIIGAGLGGFVACRALSQRNDDPTKASRPWDMVIYH